MATAYLGDGVYAAREHGAIKLMTGCHDHPIDVIYLEPATWRALLRYAEAAEAGAEGTAEAEADAAAPAATGETPAQGV